MKRKVLSLLLCLAMLLTVMQFSVAVALAETEETQTIIETSTTDTVPDSSKPEEFVINNNAAETSPNEANPQSTEEPVLVYVPLDNRPVNVDRVFYEAEAAGFKVVMPDEDLYATRLDGQPLNANGTQFGDSRKLMDWILAMDQTT
ncbi:MAG TPA: DUF4127 family protein, partial [Syntrophomonas sp.]|nr:DUF4127 family protein [Syntrophomonas sp.]